MDKMSEQSIYTKIKNALKLAKAAEVGCTFDRFEAIELLGYIQALEETVGLQRAEFDAQAARIAELERELAALKEERRWIPVSTRSPEHGELIELIDVHSKAVCSWYYHKRIDLCTHVKNYTHWRSLQPPDPQC